jgi:hypothetical protein
VVGINLQLADRLLGIDADAAAQLEADVERLIGPSNVIGEPGEPDTITEDFRDDYRNSWIAEGIGHLAVCLPEEGPGPCIPGLVHALTLPHHKSSQQGLDAVAIYDEDDEILAASIGEAKASAAHPSNHLNRAMILFRAIDAGSREHEIRAMINMLSGYLRPEVRDRVVASFWRDHRMYLPVVSYAAGNTFSPAQNRPATFGQLKVPRDRRRLVVLPLSNFHEFFDRVADSMRDAVLI